MIGACRRNLDLATQFGVAVSIFLLRRLRNKDSVNPVSSDISGGHGH
jgi:hypothetical protein